MEKARGGWEEGEAKGCGEEVVEVLVGEVRVGKSSCGSLRVCEGGGVDCSVILPVISLSGFRHPLRLCSAAASTAPSTAPTLSLRLSSLRCAVPSAGPPAAAAAPDLPSFAPLKYVEKACLTLLSSLAVEPLVLLGGVATATGALFAGLFTLESDGLIEIAAVHSGRGWEGGWRKEVGRTESRIQE